MLLVGHSHSYDAPIARMRELVEGGTLGAPRMANTWCFTDWVYRPRRPEELEVAKGGGVTFRQGAHQFDILRFLCGGLARSVRAKTFDFDPARPTIGAHVAFVDFADDAAGTAVYSGYDHLPGALLTFGIGEWGFPQAPKANMGRAAALPEDELSAKAARAKSAIPAQAPHPPVLRLTVLSCERGDVRQVPEGLEVYTRQGVSAFRSPPTARRETYCSTSCTRRSRVSARRCTTARGRWRSLELCLGAIESARAGREHALQHQVRCGDDRYSVG